MEEVLKHPAYEDTLWQLEPTRSGRLPVAEGRGGPFNIAWEVHGNGPVQVVVSTAQPENGARRVHFYAHSHPTQFIMGLGSFRNAWQRQTLMLGHEKGSQYSVLLLDNRGMGDSDRPLMRYSSSEMARDAIEVLRHVGFLVDGGGRSVHVVGLSLGGMIAQEIACLIPERLSSLSLCCTAAVVENSGSWSETVAQRSSLFIPQSVEASVRGTAQRIFSHAWLPLADDVHLPQPGTPGVRMPAHGGGYRRFDSNYQRFAAQEMHKRLDTQRFTTTGFMLQLVAAAFHRKSPAQLAAMADNVGRERIMVLHGTDDDMISVPHGRKLVDYIRPGTAHIVEGMGHAPLIERWEWYTNTIEGVFRIGEKLDGRT